MFRCSSNDYAGFVCMISQIRVLRLELKRRDHSAILQPKQFRLCDQYTITNYKLTAGRNMIMHMRYEDDGCCDCN